jgi:NADPH:quinone reductase-like Zn-dependent oxidoreductase
MEDMLTLAGTGYLGYNAAGVVDEAGAGVTGVSVGQDVFGRGQGTQAEDALLDAWAARPPSIDWAVAAAAGVAGRPVNAVFACSASRPGTRSSSTAAQAGVGAAWERSPCRWRWPAGPR